VKDSLQAIILAGGKGTRLKDISGDLPKSMVSILGKPLLQHQIEQCVQYGFLDIHLLVSYKSDVIQNFFGDGSQFGATIHYHNEDVPRGTMRAMLDVLPHLNEQFLVLYGDTYFDVDLNRFWSFHQKGRSDASLFLHPNDHPQDSDLVELDSHSKVVKIHGYPHDGVWYRNLVNAALYILNRSSLVDIEINSDRPDIAKDLFPLMVDSGKSLYGYLSTEYIKDMGTPKRLNDVEQDICSGKVESLRFSIKKKALFLDRDGVINEDVDHLSDIDLFVLIPNVGKAIRKANQAGMLVVVVSNQPVIARGELSVSNLRLIHNKLDTLLGAEGAYIDRLYYCPHHPDSGFDGEIKALKVECDCRKPNPGLFFQAVEELNISLQDSWMVGDRTSDILAGTNSNIETILVKTGYAGKDARYTINPNYVVADLAAAVELVLQNVSGK